MGLVRLAYQERVYEALVDLSLFTQDPEGWVEPDELVERICERLDESEALASLPEIAAAVNGLRERGLVEVELRVTWDRRQVMDFYRPVLTEARLKSPATRRRSALAG